MTSDSALRRYFRHRGVSGRGADRRECAAATSSRLVHRRRRAQQLRQLGDVGGDAPGLVAGELGPRQRLPAHGEKMLAYKAEQRLGTGETMRRREFIALMGASVTWPFAAMAQEAGADLSPWRRVRRSTQCAAIVAMFDELRRLGFIEGQNLTIDWRDYGQRIDLISGICGGAWSKPRSMSFMSAGMLQFALHSRRRRRFRSSGLPRIWSGRDW